MWPYVDDSVGVVPRRHAKFLFNSFIRLVEHLGLLLSATPGHIIPPSPVITALGLQYDTIANIVSLPADKLATLVSLLAAWLVKESATPKELATLAGKLLWSANVVPPGRVFLGRVLATKRFADRLGRPIVLDQEFKLDIQWWHSKVSVWNGRSFLVPSFSADVSVDASGHGWPGGGPGIGGYCFASHQFFATGVPAALADWHISDLELLAIVIAISIWGPGWHGYAVNILTDNEATRHLLVSGRTRDPLRLKMARHIIGLQFEGNFRVHPARITSEQNGLADALSRAGVPGMWHHFFSVCRSHNVSPSRVDVPGRVLAPRTW